MSRRPTHWWAPATIVATLGLLAVMSCGSVPPTSVGVTVHAGEAFAPSLAADVYVPDGDESGHPAVVLVHGGGFAFGQRQDMDGYARALASRGIVAATIDYRLSDGSWFPAQRLDDPGLIAAAAAARDDTETALSWLAANATRFGLDPRRIAVAGYSAGGITAIEVAAHDPDASGGVAMAGAAVDLHAFDAGDPALLLLHGVGDDVVPIGLADQTCAAASAAGVSCEVRRYAGSKHEIAATRFADNVEAIAAFVTARPPRGDR